MIGVLLIQFAVLVFGVPGSTVAPTVWRQWGLTTVVNHWTFDLVAWEVGALRAKLQAFWLQPARGLSYTTSVHHVHVYLDRAQEMRQINRTINEILSSGMGADAAVLPAHLQTEVQELQQQLEALRTQQLAQRPVVEQILEAQIAHELNNEDLTLLGQVFPPVQFMFVEPPRKLVVSPRDEIAIAFSRMLDAEMSLAEIEQAEATYRDEFNSSAYITNIGGLGAFPTMVVDQASLTWILSTIAHEWTHNYLTLFPLGLNYMTSHELTTINETVADIVGDELGAQALQTFYPELVPPPVAPVAVPQGGQPFVEEPLFDFRAEMHETRLVVDEMLATGRVEEAERYMEERRLYFVENGYPLRVLNQAYFAFHGSYGTSAASTSPIGPKLETLRAISPDLQSFLQTVRTFTSVADIDAALAR